MNIAENSISEPLGFNIFWGSMPPKPSLEGKTCLVCQAATLCGNSFYGAEWGRGGGVAIVPYWIWKIVRPSEKILATPLVYCDLIPLKNM